MLGFVANFFQIGYTTLYATYDAISRVSRMKGFESLHWLIDFFDKSMAILRNIIKVFYLSDLNQQKQTAHHKKQGQLQINGINTGLIGTTFIHSYLI